MAPTEEQGKRASISQSPTVDTSSVYDLVCIGFGPAQIATAIANRELKTPSRILFLERKASFSWYSSSQLPRTRMENAFVYDLATTRNPKSAFSYVNYLLSRGRLVEFANSDRMNPLREEFDDYLRWCAAQFQEQVHYNSEVVGVAPMKGANTVEGWNIAVRDGNTKISMVHARNILAPSPSSHTGVPKKPLTSVNFEAGQRIISIDDYLTRRDDLRESREPRLEIAVVGSSQQAAEILDDLLSCTRLGNVTMVTERDSLAPLRILSESQEPPRPQLCSIWARPSGEQKSTIAESSELVQSIYTRGYEKHVASKGKYGLRVVIGGEASEACAKADIIIAEKGSQLSGSGGNGLFHGIDALVLGCRQKGESVEEVQFKHGVVAEGCRMWMMSANAEGGHSLAKDTAVRAGEVVRAVAAAAEGRKGSRDGLMLLNARM